MEINEFIRRLVKHVVSNDVSLISPQTELSAIVSSHFILNHYLVETIEKEYGVSLIDSDINRLKNVKDLFEATNSSQQKNKSMTKRLFIVGGNSFARECYSHIQNNISNGDDICFGGFIEHNGFKEDFLSLSKFFVGDLSEIKFEENDYCIIGVGYPKLRNIIFNDIKSHGGQLYNLVIGKEKLDPLVEIGEGNIFNDTYPSPFVKIGNGNLFNCQIIVGHDATIGDFNFLGPRSQILGHVKIGNNNKIGANTVILPNAKIGNNNDIAPLSAVYKGCRDYCYLSGNPALKIGEIEQ